ncbi:family 10 glycosylhydrolase [Tamlana crocina]|uniref:Family 10 glycosylhydrolase n=1 Tax=Tamlana crocina TaxID=393006 RepID=A0ABX1D7T3_9FLAO|nr:family 10 glycosylhydrolase [Tamlana crocina]NJX14394.1 family 10 glycosylhydrolase [Tamlana crocina]
MKSIYQLLIIIFIVTVSCSKEKKGINTAQTESTPPPFKYWVWYGAGANVADSIHIKQFKKYASSGINAVLIDTRADADYLSKVAPLAIKEGLEVHAWMFTMNRPGDTTALKHPDWYMVSRSGKSCFDDRPYVDYYQWLSPSHPEARQHIWNLVEGLAKVEGIKSVHLDYIRYPDVFLPVGLLPKYNLVQNEELPDFDFDYSMASVDKFKKLFGKDITQAEVPAIDIEWKQFRLNEIKAVVDGAYDIAHKHGKDLTAAVFPYPEMADHMVRQRWDKWNIDAVMPMIYNNFYNEGLDWIEFATKQGLTDLKAKQTKLHTGLYLPEMTDNELAKAIAIAKQSGASGVAFFDIQESHFEVIKASH